VGSEIKAATERELAPFYPPDPDGARPIAYLWARTVHCEAPHCGAEIPLVRSFWLCKKANRKKALRYRVIEADKGVPQVVFELFEPEADREVPPGTVSRAKARCLSCNAPLSPERVRAQLVAQRGGADVTFNEQGQRQGGARLLAVVTIQAGQQGRFYRLPREIDYQKVFKAQYQLKMILDEWERDGKKGLCPLPEEPIHTDNRGNFWVTLYGPSIFSELFTARQKLALTTLVKACKPISNKDEVSQSLSELCSLLIDRLADYSSSLCAWHVPKQLVANTFRRQALPIVWDFCEIVPFGDGPGNFEGAIQWVSEVLDNFSIILHNQGQAILADACKSPLPSSSSKIWFTDPPYYDAVAYAGLSDFFYVWLKRALPKHPLLYDPSDPNNPLTPKYPEIIKDGTILDNGIVKDAKFYEHSMGKAFSEGRRILRDDGIGSVVFAHKTTEGWEALLSGMLKAGWIITASWPIHTEMGARLRAKESAALASSIHLVCRPRPKEAGVGDWAEVRAEMDRKVRTWMERLDKEGIRGADAIFSCIGPALEVYSRYTRVETPAGHAVPLGGDPEAFEPQERGFLAYIFETVSREALRQVLGGADTEGFEEDARLTALFLWTLQSTRTNGNNRNGAPASEGEVEDEEDLEEEEAKPKKAKGGLALPFDVFIRLTRPMGIHYQNWERRIVNIEKGVVHLTPVVDRKEALLGEGADFEPVALARRRPQKTLFDMPEAVAQAARPRRGPALAPEEMTTLDRVHRAMLLFAAGQTVTLQRLLQEERLAGKRFERLALSLNALYPPKSPERRWLEGVQGMMKMR